MRGLTVCLSFLIFATICGKRLSQKEREELNKKRKETAIEVTKNELPVSKILCPNKSPFDYISDEEIYTDKGNQILLGIQVDNYSGMTLKNPIFTPYYEAITTVNKLENVGAKRSEFFVLQNPNNYVAGSISWEIFKHQEHLAKRLIVTFNVPWK